MRFKAPKNLQQFLEANDDGEDRFTICAGIWKISPGIDDLIHLLPGRQMSVSLLRAVLAPNLREQQPIDRRQYIDPMELESFHNPKSAFLMMLVGIHTRGVASVASVLHVDGNHFIAFSIMLY